MTRTSLIAAVLCVGLFYPFATASGQAPVVDEQPTVLEPVDQLKTLEQGGPEASEVAGARPLRERVLAPREGDL